MVVIAVITAVIVQVIGFFLAKKYDTSERTDKGMEFCYWRLSYRRKFIRTLWLVPIFAVIIIAFYQTFRSDALTWFICTAVFVSIIIQAIYNYKKWKSENQRQ